MFFVEVYVSGVSNVHTNSERTVLQWDQVPNTDYPDCITSYSVGWNGMTYNTIDTVNSVTRKLLSASGFPFCTSTSVTVTPVTPMGPLSRRDSTADVSLISPGITNNIYYNYYCIHKLLFHSSTDFVTPAISGVYNMVNRANGTMNITIDGIVFSGMVQVRSYTESLIISSVPQGISQIVNPTRMNGYSRAGMACTPNTVFTGDSFEFTLPDDADSGQAFTMCVQLTSGDCMEMALRNFTSKSIILIHLHDHVLPHSNYMTCDVSTTSTHAVPGQTITVQDEMVSGTSFTVTVNLPITEYQPDQLQIIVSLIPNDTAPVVADFPASYQYTVMFSDLMYDTSYNYSVWIMRRSDMTDAVDHFVGFFAIAALRKFSISRVQPIFHIKLVGVFPCD